ncbi:hypothetical protein [Larkinella soli]|uniref:hypothetical protein n=1 Tax=Larkinella soli TaxID=1770527 RepID=UPI000FFB3A4A|nr:hypothetical protein [Larkinella soli]
MNDTEPMEERPERLFRTLYSEEEARQFARPEVFRLPTHRIAIWSAGVSLLVACALVVSWAVERGRPQPGSKADSRSTKKASILPAKRVKNSSATYRR